MDIKRNGNLNNMGDEEFNLSIPVEVEKALNICTNLPSLPAVALSIIEASKDPDITLHEVSSIISSDPAISAKLLKVANSPLYSQRRSLNNLREALTLLGFNASLTIALSFSLLQSLGDSNVHHENFWKRSILAASIARIIGTRLKLTRLEDLFLASLLQDIGILVIQCFEDSPYSGSNKNDLNHRELVDLEENELGVDHTVIGAWLLKSWRLPDYLVKSVMHSHSLNIPGKPQADEDMHFQYCINLSGHLADVWLNENHGELLLSILDVAKKVLNIEGEEFNQFVVDIDDSLPAISDMFELFLVENAEREKVLHEAREILLERSIHTIKQHEDDRRYIDGINERIDKIEKSSRIDHLTKVYNRQHIDKMLENEYEESNINRWPLSLAFIDIDDFKIINDSFGHLVGDEILKLISEFFSKNIRETDMLARYGGDEFLMVLPGATSSVAASAIERLLSLFKETVKLKVKEIDVSASLSIGLATHMEQHDFASLKEFIAAADDALYKAKNSGKNCLVTYSN